MRKLAVTVVLVLVACRSHPAVVDLAPLRQAEAHLQHVALDGTSAEYVVALGEVERSARGLVDAAEPDASERLSYAIGVIRAAKVSERIGEASVRLRQAQVIHEGLERFDLATLPYPPDPEVTALVHRRGETVAASGQEALAMITADADAVCSCNDVACTRTAGERLDADLHGLATSLPASGMNPSVADAIVSQAKRGVACLR
jgi:hypothetical protein